MVGVPTYGAPRVDPAPLPNSYLQPVESNAGQQVNAALQGFGDDLGQAARNVQAIQDMHDEAAVKQAEIQYGQLENKVLYDPDTGLFHQQGKNALDMAPTAREQLAGQANDLVGATQNDRQRQMLAQVLQNRALQSNQMMDTFLGKQTTTYNDEMSTARITSLTDEGQRAYAVDPVAGMAKLQAAQDEQQAMDVRQGIPVDYHVLNHLKVSSDFWGGVIKNSIAANDPVTAQQLLDAHQADLSYAQRTALEAPVADALSVAKANAAANNTFNAGVAGAAQTTTGPGGAPPTPAMGVNPVADQVRSLAKGAGATPQEGERMVRDGMVESRLDPVRDNGNSKGLFQFSTVRGPNGEPSTWDRFGGGGDIHDVGAQVKAKLALDRYNEGVLTKALGRAPTDEEMYLIHQQGEGAAPALLKAPPGVGAVAALEGVGLSPGLALAHIKKNLPASMQGQASTITAGDFVQHWEKAWSGNVTTAVAQQANTPVAQATPSILPDRDTYVNQVVSQAGGDVVQQQRNRAAATKKWEQEHSAQNDRWEAADQAVQPLLQQHVPVSQWPSTATAALKPETLTKYMAADAKEGRPTDQLYLAKLRDTYASAPDAFLKISPADALQHLSNSDFEKFTGWRQEALQNRDKGPTEGQVTAGKIEGMARLGLGMTGIVHYSAEGGVQGPNPRTLRTPANVQGEYSILNRLVSRVQQDVQTYTQQDPHHKPPDDGTLQKIIDGHLLRGSWTAVSAGGQEVPRARLPEFLAPPGAHVTYEMTPGERLAVRRAYVQRNGVPPKESDIQSLYPRLKQAGLL